MDVPDAAKEVKRFIKTGEALKSQAPFATYWCWMHALEVMVPRVQQDTSLQGFVVRLMDSVEEMKNAYKDLSTVSDKDTGREAVALLAAKVFQQADKEDRAGATMATALKFRTASTLFDVCRTMNPDVDEFAEQRKYAKVKMVHIQRAIKAGKTPVPGPVDTEGNPIHVAEGPELYASGGEDGQGDEGFSLPAPPQQQQQDQGQYPTPQSHPHSGEQQQPYESSTGPQSTTADTDQEDMFPMPPSSSPTTSFDPYAPSTPGDGGSGGSSSHAPPDNTSYPTPQQQQQQQQQHHHGHETGSGPGRVSSDLFPSAPTDLPSAQPQPTQPPQSRYTADPTNPPERPPFHRPQPATTGSTQTTRLSSTSSSEYQTIDDVPASLPGAPPFRPHELSYKQEQLIQAACKRIVSSLHFHDSEGVNAYLLRAMHVLHCDE